MQQSSDEHISNNKTHPDSYIHILAVLF